MTDIEMIAYSTDYDWLTQFREFLEKTLKFSFWRDNFAIANILRSEKNQDYVFAVVISLPDFPMERKPIKLVEVGKDDRAER